MSVQMIGQPKGLSLQVMLYYLELLSLKENPHSDASKPCLYMKNLTPVLCFSPRSTDSDAAVIQRELLV